MSKLLKLIIKYNENIPGSVETKLPVRFAKTADQFSIRFETDYIYRKSRSINTLKIVRVYT